MRPSRTSAARRRASVWDILSFERMLTGPMTYLIYWCGLGLIILLGFSVVGASIGLAIRGGSLEGALMAIPVLVAGILVIVALVLLWRWVCEFYLAVFQIAEDLHAIRLDQLRAAASEPAPPASPRSSGESIWDSTPRV